MKKIIDFHAHAFPTKIAEKAVEQLEIFYGIKISNQGELEPLLSSADKAGVSKICLHAAATKPSQVRPTNDWMAGVCSERILGFGTIHPDYEDWLAELDRMKELGLTGIKFHADLQGFELDDPQMWPIYEAIDDRFLVMFHVGDKISTLASPERLAKVLDNFPKLKAVAAHLGGYSNWAEARELLYGRNLYVDTSSALWCMEPKEARRLIYAHGVDRVLFGTDYPIATAAEELERLEALDLTGEEMDLILWSNGARLLELDKRNMKVLTK
ncbi:MAG: amidohydrolase family protein [Thermincolia bacterium]